MKMSSSSNDGKNRNYESITQYICSCFLTQARIGSPKILVETDEDEEVVPNELNTINSSSGFLIVAPDKLSVKYKGEGAHGHDVGVVQANHPVPVKRLVYYFEIYVKDAGTRGQIAIGFTSKGFKMRRQPGWEVNSCGYHGDDGLVYCGRGKGDAFGPTYTTGDTVGGGINFASQEFFFTKNGAMVGTVIKEKEMKHLFPTIAVHSQNEEVHVNFGKKNFAFDLKEYETQERLKQQMTIEKIPLPPNISYRLVRTYLLHYGYEDTLNSFDLASKSIIPPVCIAQENVLVDEKIMYGLNQRKTIRQLIRNGEIDAAMNKLHVWYPQIVQGRKSGARFLLHCQKFVELIRVGALEEAVMHGRIEFATFFGLPKENIFGALVTDCAALLAYESPQESCVGYLLNESHRDVVADAINSMILSTNPKIQTVLGCLQSYLETILRQLTACSLERRFATGGHGEAFNLHRLLN